MISSLAALDAIVGIFSFAVGSSSVTTTGTLPTLPLGSGAYSMVVPYGGLVPITTVAGQALTLASSVPTPQGYAGTTLVESPPAIVAGGLVTAVAYSSSTGLSTLTVGVPCEAAWMPCYIQCGGLTATVVALTASSLSVAGDLRGLAVPFSFRVRALA